MKKIIKGISLVLAMILLLSACGNENTDETDVKEVKKGLDIAYERLKDSGLATGSTTFEYDEEEDILTLNLDEYRIELDKVFLLLNMSTSHADVGTIIFKRAGIMGSNDFYDEYSKRIGNLRCNSIKCLDISSIAGHFFDDSWTKIVPKTEVVYEPDFTQIEKYSNEAQKRFEDKKSLWINGNTNISYDFSDAMDLLPNIEEVRVTAGLTKEDRETAMGRDFQLNYQYTEYGDLGEFKNLKRFLIYPELDSWKPDSSYYTNILHMQYAIPTLKINKAGMAWDGKDDSLIEVNSIKVLKESKKSKDVAEALERYLQNQAESCYKAGKKYRKSSKKPVLNGRCFVYMAYPFDSQWGKSTFYSYGSLVLVDEFLKTKVKMPENPNDYTTFVYVYPKFTHVGQYTNGSKAYTTRTQVRVYDMENKIRYDDVQIDEIQPAKTIYVSKSSHHEHEYSNMNRSHIKKYLTSLKRK